jgi:uncharacterized UPF0160 family protein
MKKANKLVTHNGSFHSDDIFACATLSLLLEKKGETFEVIRTRDEEIIKSGDYVFDIGGFHDEKTNRFDHHQKGGAGAHFGVEYSSFGLVWKKFGVELCGSEKVSEIIDKKLVAPVDAFDNGMDLVQNKYEITPYYIQHLFFSMRPTWREEDVSKDEVFLECVELAKNVLRREIKQTQDILLAEELVTASYKNSIDKKIIILDGKYPFETLHNFMEPLFVIYPRVVTGDWAVEAVRDDFKVFKNRKDLPKSWAGLRYEELEKVAGVPGAIFCHRGLYLAVSKTKEGAIKLAQIAVES